MRIFQDKEQMAEKDAEFLTKLHQLVNEIYGDRISPFEDGMVLETLLAGAAQHQATMLLQIGATSIEEGYQILGVSEMQAEEWVLNAFKKTLNGMFEIALANFNNSAPQTLLDERDLIRQELDLDMQAAITEQPANTKNFAS